MSFLVVFYQVCISSVLRPHCRFYPTCSHYALSAIKYYGILKGSRLTCCRLLRCHPWAEGGYDPVLPKEETK